MEARFFLSRIPQRWGRRKCYYLTAFTGVALLAMSGIVWPFLARSGQWPRDFWLVTIASWNTLFVVWLMILVELRRRESTKRNWSWCVPAGFMLIAINWMWPLAWSLMLVYLHPLVALWFLDCELGKRFPRGQVIYRRCLAMVPFLLLALIWRLRDAPSFAGEDLLTLQITRHAGANLLQGVSTHLLVAIHTFLEMLHYFAWIVLIPLIGYAGTPWNLRKIPLVHRSSFWKIFILAFLLLGIVLVLVLWAGFLADYPFTRNLYFSIALIHVLVEFPFLLRQF
ncbi:MAG: hypothetical protein Tsb009_27890 [Planctomycetaceae bacterium]